MNLMKRMPLLPITVRLTRIVVALKPIVAN
jgi:hypothetical protein